VKIQFYSALISVNPSQKIDSDNPIFSGLLDNSRTANSRTSQLAVWTVRGLDKSQTSQITG